MQEELQRRSDAEAAAAAAGSAAASATPASLGAGNAKQLEEPDVDTHQLLAELRMLRQRVREVMTPTISHAPMLRLDISCRC